MRFSASDTLLEAIASRNNCNESKLLSLGLGGGPDGLLYLIRGPIRALPAG